METSKIIFIAIHNLLRWVILGLGLVTLFRMYKGWLTKKRWNPFDQKIGMFFTMALDVQLLVGLLLYFVFSDLTKVAFTDIGAAMSNTTLRFFTVEHVLFMVIAIITAHIGNSIGKNETNDTKIYKKLSLAFSISIIFIVLAIPWTTRPLLPGM